MSSPKKLNHLRQISFEQIKREFLRIETELRSIEDEYFGEMTFEEARLLIQIKRRMAFEMLDKIRLFKDLKTLDSIPLLNSNMENQR